MILSRKKIVSINSSISLVTAVLIFVFWMKLQTGALDFLHEINKPLIMLSTNPLDVLIIACIPLWTYPLYSRRATITIGRVVMTNVIAVLILMLSCILAFIAIVKSQSVFIPENLVFMPFLFFPTVVLLTGMLLTYLILIPFSWENKNA